MWEMLLLSIYLQIPIVLGGILHMVVVTLDLLPQLKRPMHLQLFGKNKTWRGVLVMPLMTVLGVWLMQAAGYLFQIQDWSEVSAITLGLILGLAYILFELPNSFVKRRLGIKPGEIPERNKYLFILMDQFDSGIGFALAYYLFYDISLSLALLIMLTFPVVALLVKRMLFLLKLKKHYT